MPDMERLYQEYARQVYKYIFSLWVFNNPFDDVGSAFTLGSELPGPDSQTGVARTVTIEFADKTVQFINGRLVESPL